MQPFRITCVTCQSRLKIRSADVIGEIHACPKCGSMVQIVPPPGWDTSIAAMSADQPNAVGEAALTISTTASVIIPAGAMDDLGAVADALEAPAVELPVEMAQSPSVTPAASGSPILWWAVGGTAAVFVLGGLTWALWPGSGNKPVPATPPVVASKSAEVATPPSEEPKPETAPAEKSEPKPSNIAAPPATEPVKPEPVANVAKPNDPMPPTPAPVEASSELPKPVDPPKVASVETPANRVPAPAPAKVAEAVPSAPDHSPVLKFDPLDFDPDRLSATTKIASDARESTSSIPDKAAVEPVVNGAVDNAAPAQGDLTPPDKAPAASNVLLPRVGNNSIAVRRGPPADVASHATGKASVVRLKSFQVTDMPLARFIEMLSNVSGTGVTLDPVALEQVGISPAATVSVNAQDAPLQAILHDALTQRRLDIAERGGQLRVILPKADEPHTIDYDVKDLATGADGAAVGKLIERFVAQATWKSAGGAGTIEVKGTTLHIEQSDAVRREVVIFCERLRLGRGAAIQSKYPAAMLSVEPPNQRLVGKLSEHATFTFLPWTRLADVVRNWQEMSGIAVLVDWGALAEGELGPTSPVACSAIDRTWQESLDGVLEPLGLGWWAVNGETIQITSLAALEKIQRVEFYQVPAKLRDSFASSQALVDSLQKELGEAAGKSGKSAPVHMEVDEPSGRLIVLASPAAHRHLSQRLAGGAKQ